MACKVMFAIFGIALLLGAAADRPVATITSADAFNIGGVQVAATGVSSWPLMAGDEVQTLRSGAVIRMHDGTRIALAKASSLKLERGGGAGMIVRLTAGDMRYKLEPNAQTQIFAGARRLHEMEDSVAVQGERVVKKGNGPPLDPPGPPPGRPRGRSQGQ